MDGFIDLATFDARLRLVGFALFVLAVCAASSLAVAFLRRVLRLNRTRPLRVFWSDEDGAAYSLSFVMVLPFYVFLMCFTLEIMFLMIAKIGAVHACQAAVRAAAVHSAVARPDDRGSNDWIPQAAKAAAKKAAVVSMTPYASAVDPDYRAGSPDGVAFHNAYKDYISMVAPPDDSNGFCKVATFGVPVSQLCLSRRYASASGRIDVNLVLDPAVEKTIKKNEPWRKCLKCELNYRAPFQLPAIGYVLGGRRDGNAVVRDVKAAAYAQVECPKNDSGFLGVALPWNVQ